MINASVIGNRPRVRRVLFITTDCRCTATFIAQTVSNYNFVGLRRIYLIIYLVISIHFIIFAISLVFIKMDKVKKPITKQVLSLALYQMKLLGITQKQLSHATGLHVAYLSSMFQGKFSPSIDTVVRIYSYLNICSIPIDDCFDLVNNFTEIDSPELPFVYV